MKPLFSIEDRPPLPVTLPLSLQHLFAMAGATIVVPTILGIDPGTVLLFNGIGTLIFLVVCRWKVPAYLGPSFAYIPVSQVIIQTIGYGAALSGYIVSGVFFLLASAGIRQWGTGWVRVLFPGVIIAPIVTIIGLELAPEAAKMAGFIATTPDPVSIGIALFTLVLTIVLMTMTTGMFRIFPIMCGILSGYVLSVLTGYVSIEPVLAAPWFAIPTFYTPEWSVHAIILVIPASFVTFAELVGHLEVTGTIVGRDLMRDPGIDRTLIGKGISTLISGFFGSPPNTTYAENIGVLAITRVYSTYILAGTAVIAIVIAFCGKLTIWIRTIPDPVIGGISLLLFGVIAASGIRMLIENRIDLSEPRNLAIVSVILICGLSQISLDIGPMDLEGMSLATFIGLLFAIVYYTYDRAKQVRIPEPELV